MKVVVQTSESAMKTFRLISNLTIKNIINYLKENGSCPPSQIAREMGISPSTASRCLQELRKYNVVKARWETKSIEDRPLKLYSLVPNVLRFEVVLNDQASIHTKPEHGVEFCGTHLSDLKDGDRKIVYASLNDVPFRFEGFPGELLKEISRGNHTLQDLNNKFKEEKEFESTLKHMVTLGLIKIGPPKA